MVLACAFTFEACFSNKSWFWYYKKCKFSILNIIFPLQQTHILFICISKTEVFLLDWNAYNTNICLKTKWRNSPGYPLRNLEAMWHSWQQLRVAALWWQSSVPHSPEEVGGNAGKMAYFACCLCYSQAVPHGPCHLRCNYGLSELRKLCLLWAASEYCSPLRAPSACC